LNFFKCKKKKKCLSDDESIFKEAKNIFGDLSY